MNLVRTFPRQQLAETRKENSQNGNEAEGFAASILVSALGAEISWGSRNEDSRKIDLVCSFEHPWYSDSVFVPVQVKSGKAFGIALSDGFRLLSSAKKKAKRTSHSILVIWVDRVGSRSFWAYLRPRGVNSNQDYGSHHEINPCLKFDLARIQSENYLNVKGGKGIIIKGLPGFATTNRKVVVAQYKAQKLNAVVNPNLGAVEFTSLAWRHMFRKGRKRLYKSQSLEIIPYLSMILTQGASEVYTTNVAMSDFGDFYYRDAEYVLRYNEVQLSSPGSPVTKRISVIFRFVEAIRWPKNWQVTTAKNYKITRRVVLLSASHKIK